MNYEIYEIIISYGISLIGIEIMNFSDILVKKWKRNILTVFVAIFGMLTVGYSFLKMWRGSSMYINNYLNNPYLKMGLTTLIVRMCIPMIIILLIGFVALKLSDLYKKRSKNTMYGITIISSALSMFGGFIMILTMFSTILNNVS